MNCIGVFKTGKFYLNEMTLNFSVINTEFVHKNIYALLTCDVKFTIGTDVYYGYIDGESSKSDKMTLFLKIKTKDMGSIGKYKGQIITVNMAPVEGSKTKRYANATLQKKVEWMIGIIASERGNTVVEETQELQQQFSGNLIYGNFEYHHTDGVTLSRFATFIELEAANLGIKLTHGEMNDMDKFIKGRIVSNECCLCKGELVGIIDIYPFCKKHLMEEEIKFKDHPKIWKREFMKKNHF